HPNIVAIWDFGDDNGVPFLVMEYIDGRGLNEIIKSSGPLAAKPAIAIIAQVLSALGFAHDSGIVHRDIKPSNIMVLRGGQVKVADFGVARIDSSEFTIVGDLLGTPAYMAPEQLSGGSIDSRTDLFAAGVILFEMLSGVKPFRGKSITEIISFMETRGPEDIRALNPAVPDSLKRVIGKALAFDPTERYVSAAEFSAALFEAAPDTVGELRILETAASEPTTAEAKIRAVAQAAPTAPGTVSLAPELLREIERDLATCIGPMASVAVKRAARETNDVLKLYEMLGRQVDSPPDRAEFLAKGRQRAAGLLGRPRPLATPKAERVAERARDVPDTGAKAASIVAIESDLTRYIGPIARILVRRELEKFESLAKFCLDLAEHIPDERERRAFLNAHGGE
ncbi:MAG: serine/threonine-protein kinase, partial [Stellaceae bacterium]